MAKRYGSQKAPAAYIKGKAEQAKARNPEREWKDIAASFGINERTLRKYRAGQGEASGRRTFRRGRLIPDTQFPDRFTIPLRIDDDTYTSINVVVPGGKRLSLFNVFDISDDPATREAVDREMVRRSLASRTQGSAGYYVTPEQRAKIQILGARRVSNQRRTPIILRGLLR